MAWQKLNFEKLKLDFNFSSGTSNYPEEEIFLQQERLEKAFDLALKLDKDGYNVYVCGPNGIGRSRYTLKRLQEIASTKERPSDICYVNNFKDFYRPKAIVLPAGYGKKLAEHIEEILDFLKRETFKAFEGKEYEEELSSLSKEIDSQKEKIINELVEEAKKYNLMVLFGPEGVRLLPMFKIETPVPQETLLENPQIREEYQKNLSAFEPTFREYMRKLRELDSSFGESLTKLREKIATNLVNKAFEKLENEFKELENVKEFIS